MAEVAPLKALRYNLEKTGGLQPVVAPPYDVIDAELKAKLQAQSPYNAVTIDLPEALPNHGDRYAQAAATLSEWIKDQIVVADDEDAIWPLEQDYTGPDGQPRTRKGFLARVRVEEYGPGKVRPHERTHPGPKVDRLNLTRATKANLSPIFALYSDPDHVATDAINKAIAGQTPFGTQTDLDGTVNRLYRVTDPETINAVQQVAKTSELLIADGHHRYETARVYAEEIGPQDGPHQYLLTCLVALEDPGLTVFPTHRLLNKLSQQQREALRDALRANFTLEQLDSTAELTPPANEELQLGYLDSQHKTPYRLQLTNKQLVDELLADHAPAYRNLDTAVLEALILKHTLGYTDDQIDHLDGLWYARDDDDAVQLVLNGDYEAAFFMAPIPVARIHEVAAAGESMPPKSTYFYPKVPTGLLFNPLGSTSA
jgi:uncharacterized protein (DUF1015 family)